MTTILRDAMDLVDTGLVDAAAVILAITDSNGPQVRIAYSDGHIPRKVYGAQCLSMDLIVWLQ